MKEMVIEKKSWLAQLKEIFWDPDEQENSDNDDKKILDNESPILNKSLEELDKDGVARFSYEKENKNGNKFIERQHYEPKARQKKSKNQGLDKHQENEQQNYKEL